MQFKPKSEEEDKKVKDFSLLPDGDYDFEVLGAEERFNTAGEPYIAMKLGVWDQGGRQQWVFNNLSASDTMLWKLRHFAGAVGIMAAYESGDINPLNLMGLSGKCKIYSKKDGKGILRNDVKDYIPRVSKPASFSETLKKGINSPVSRQTPSASVAEPIDDDEIPF